jgi:hypothetical protein
LSARAKELLQQLDKELVEAGESRKRASAK